MAPELKQTEREGWTFAVSPYFWAAGMSGDTGLFGLPTVHTDMKFGDILKDLDFAAMAIGEARYERYSIFADIMYSKYIERPRHRQGHRCRQRRCDVGYICGPPGRRLFGAAG
jgi:hypothetical protein